MAFHVPEHHRLRTGELGTTKDYGNNGVFILPNPHPKSVLYIRAIASDGGGWEHVSVSLRSRCPTWAEMCYIKSLFWDEEDCVMQLHPPKSQWVNDHEFCLHLWRPTEAEIPTPPKIFV